MIFSKRQSSWIWGTILVIFFVFGIWDFAFRKNQLSENSNYTIGTTTEKFRLARGSLRARVEYNVNGKVYSKIQHPLKNTKIPGGRYYVKFSPVNPSNCSILFDKQVPASIKEAPPEGWEFIPK